jgi:sRNA-binding protein
MAEQRKLIAPAVARVAAIKTGLAVEPVTVEPVTVEPTIAREAKRAAYRDELVRRFPEVFGRPDVPLAIGIHRQIRAVIRHGRKTREAVLHHWTHTPAYLAAIAAGVQRRSLDGSLAGEPTDAERASAGERLRAIESSAASSPRSDDPSQ